MSGCRVVWSVSGLKPTSHAFENFIPAGWWAGWLILKTPLQIYSLWDVRVLSRKVVWLVSGLKPTSHGFENFILPGWWADGLILKTPLQIYSHWDVRVLSS